MIENASSGDKYHGDLYESGVCDSYLSLAHKMSSLFLSWTAGAVYLLGCFGGGVIERSHSAILSARLSIHRLFKVLFMYINTYI